MKYIFGPVNSRRLGRSLGIDFYLQKTCNLNCVYCEIGPSQQLFSKRKEYTPTEEIIREVDSLCDDKDLIDKIDAITITGTGEPTLHTGLGDILSHVKKRVIKPVTVITNGVLLHEKEVQQELFPADVVMPSLDAALTSSFVKVDRPAQNIDLDEIITGITSFSHAFPGKTWLEVLLVKDVNDSAENVDKLIHVMSKMSLDKIQLNTVFRPPANKAASPVDTDFLSEVAKEFERELSVKVDVPRPSNEIENPIGEESTIGPLPSDLNEDEIVNRILEMIKRRPCTASDLNRTFRQGSPEKIAQLLKPLIQQGVIKTYNYQNTKFYQTES